MPTGGFVATFDPERCTIALGPSQITGFAPGTFVTVEQTDPSFVVRAGADGEVARARKPARVATMTLTLMSTALANAVLSALAESEEIFSVLIKEGNTAVFGAQAWVEKPANFERGDEVTDTEWSITIAHVKLEHGGNG